MTTSLTTFRQALADAVDTIPGLRASWFVDSDAEPPFAMVTPGFVGTGSNSTVVEFDHTMANGSHCYYFTVAIYVSNTVDRVAQEQLDGFVSPDGTTSVRAKIDEDPTLGGLVSYARAKAVTHYGPGTLNQLSYLVGAILVEVVT